MATTASIVQDQVNSTSDVNGERNTSSNNTSQSPSMHVPMLIAGLHIGKISLSALLCGYASGCLIVYEIKRRMNSATTMKTTKERRLAIISRVLCLVAALLGTATAMWSLVEFLSNLAPVFGLEALKNQTTCDAVVPAWGLLACTTVIYMFLWVRQRVFYVSPALKQLRNTFLTALSYIILIAWVAYFVYGSVHTLGYFKKLYYPSAGCVLVKGAEGIVATYFMSWMIACSCMQGALLLLFIYPLLKRRCSSSSVMPTQSSQTLHSRIVKATVMTSVCIGTDIFAYLTFYVISNRTFPIYELNFTINVYSIIMCFDFWREILLPCSCNGKNQTPPSNHVRLSTLSRSTTTSQA